MGGWVSALWGCGEDVLSLNVGDVPINRHEATKKCNNYVVSVEKLY